MAKKPPAAQTNDPSTTNATDKKRSRGNFPHVILKVVTALVRTNPSSPEDDADWSDPVEAFILVHPGPLKNNIAGRKYIEATFDDGEYKVVQIKSTAKVETETVKKKVLK